MHQRRSLQGLSGRLMSQAGRGQFAQFIINQREQLFGSLGIACINRAEQLGDIGHGPKMTKPRSESESRFGKKLKTLTLVKTHSEGKCRYWCRKRKWVSPKKAFAG